MLVKMIWDILRTTVRYCSTIKLNIARKSPDEEIPVSIRGTLLSRKSLTASLVSLTSSDNQVSLFTRNHRDLQLNGNSQQSESETWSDTNSQAEMPLTDSLGIRPKGFLWFMMPILMDTRAIVHVESTTYPHLASGSYLAIHSSSLPSKGNGGLFAWPTFLSTSSAAPL